MAKPVFHYHRKHTCNSRETVSHVRRREFFHRRSAAQNLESRPSWTATETVEKCGCAQTDGIALSDIYVAIANVDNATTINLALQRGYHLLLTPGVYQLDQPIVVRNTNTIVLGIGLATLQPTLDTPALVVADVDGVTIAGILLDAGQSLTPNLIQIGDSGSSADHSTTAIFDVSCRVGGAAPTAKTMSFWLRRADHGAQSSFTGWDVNPASNGLIVNGDNVVAYGLFVEHFEEFQTLWNGNGGSVYFYQSECPYDVPSQAEWTQGGENGFPSYKVGSSVTSHKGEGIGIYSNFYNQVHLENAIETPTGSEIEMSHLITVWLNGNNQSAIDHTISQSPE